MARHVCTSRKYEAGNANISPAIIHDVAKVFPRAKFIVPHFGCGQLEDTFMLCWVCPNVCIDTSGSNQWIRWMPYNKTLLDEAGIAIEDIPTELMAWAQMASDLAKWNGDTLEVAGCTWQPDGQYHSWVRPVLMTQFGGTPLSEDGKTASWNSPECLEAFKFFVGLNTDLKVGVKNFYTDDVTAFSSGKAYFHVDGSYRLGTLRSSVSDFEWGVMELPAYNGNKGSFGSFWTNGITALTQSDPDKYDASLKFLEFLASEKVMERWTEEVGEIGARKSIADNETFQSDPTLKPFLSALEYATSYFYVDESADRQIMLDAIDEVVLNGKDPETALNEANAKVQALLDEFWLD